MLFSFLRSTQMIFQLMTYNLMINVYVEADVEKGLIIQSVRAVEHDNFT